MHSGDPMPHPQRVHPPEKARILVVEDEPVVSEIIQTTLEDLGYEVAAAVTTAEEAIDKAEELRPDLVMMDVGLPGRMDGVEAAIRIQSDAEIPVVYLSALFDDDFLERAKVNAPYGYVLKPFKPRELHVTIQMALQRRHQEIVARRRAEGLLLREKTTAQKYLEVAGVILVALNREGEITLINPRGCRALGYEGPQGLLGKNWFHCCLPPESRERVQKVFRNLMAGKTEPFEYDEDLILTQSGERRRIAWHNVLLRDEEGRSIGTLSSGEDITERKDMERTLRQSEKRYRDLAELLPEVVFEMDEKCFVTFVNKRASALFGLSREEWGRGPHALEFIAPEDRDRARKNLLHLLEGKRVGKSEYTALRKDGTRFPIIARSAAIRHGDEIVGLRGIMVDVTEQKRAEAALLKEKVFSEAAIESLPGNFYVLDENRQLVKWNKNLERSSGYSASEISVMKATDFFVEEDRKRLVERIQEAFLTKELGIEVRMLTKDGRAIPYHYRGVRMDIDGKKHLVGLGLDISERIRAEEAKAELESLLRRAQKMEAIGTLAGGIAHDFNNILAAMTGYAELAHLEAQGNTAVRESLDEVLQAGRRAKELTKQILLFSRQTDRKRKPLQVNLILKEALNLMRATLPATIEIRQRIDVETALVLADPTEIHQTVINLCANAKDAMEDDGGVLEVVLTTETLDSGHAAEYPGLTPGPYVKLIVRDTGHGMEKGVVDRIFDPFYTTKAPGRGTGMGLSVVHGIIENLGGAIAVNSTPGWGTVFEVLIPKLEKGVPVEEGIKEGVPTGQGRILFVDDEPALVNSYRRIIANLGYDVVARTSSMEALETFRRQPDDYDLVISDMTMPNLTGVDLARELRQIRPEVPIILCTGFSDTSKCRRAEQIGITDVLMKPIPLNELAVSIRNALHGRGEQRSAPHVTILVVDDDEPVRELLRQMLEMENYSVLAAGNGKEALRMLGREHVDLIVTDIFMPETDGLEIISKGREQFPDVKMIAISGGGRTLSKSFLGDARNLGADRVFSKPLDREAFLEAVRALVGTPREPPAAIAAGS